MYAKDVMSSPVYVVAPGEPVAYARNQMLKHKVSRLLVMEDDHLKGIITKKDIGYRLRQSGPVWRRRPIDMIPVHVLMVPDPVTVKPDCAIAEMAAIMVDRNISSLPVVDDGKVLGIITKSDVLKSSHVQDLNLSVSDVMVDATQVSRYHSLDHIIDTMSERNDKLIVVNNDGTIAGIITESNLAFYEYAAGRGGLPEKDVTRLRRQESGGRKQFRYVIEVSAVAEDLMTRPVITLPPDASLRQAVELMREHSINSVVIVDGNEIKGIVKRDDILQEVAQ